MAYVYILQSDKNGKFYIGSTENIERRLEEHNSGKVFSTKGLRPLKLIFKQYYGGLKTAKRIERKVKSLKRRDYIIKIVKEGNIKILV